MGTPSAGESAGRGESLPAADVMATAVGFAGSLMARVTPNATSIASRAAQASCVSHARDRAEDYQRIARSSAMAAPSHRK